MAQAVAAVNNQFPKGYGYIKDEADDRDYRLNFAQFTFNAKDNEAKQVDLRDKCPDVYDQGRLGSCTANATAGAYQFGMMKQKEDKIFVPSRLFIYYNTRKIEGNIDKDSGATIRNSIKSVGKDGVVAETEWPYDISKFADKPPDKLYKEAQNHTAVKYFRLKQDLDSMRECLITGFPFVFGFSVYQSFESQEVAKTGKMPMPKDGEKIVGGHAVMAVGYDDNSNVMIIRNSWGKSWGIDGYFEMPYDFIKQEKYCNDFWVIEKVKDDDNSQLMSIMKKYNEKKLDESKSDE